jgi:NADH-quinone oxidoreductase subunit L
MTETALLRWILLLPAAGVLICLSATLARRPRLATLAGPGVVVVAFLLSLIAVSKLWTLPQDGVLVDHLYTWISASPLTVDATLRVDRLTSVMILIITGVGSLIHVYSIGYMHDDPDTGRFFTYLNLFVSAMLILVLGDSLPLLFIGWEGVGLCSYLLIGFWYKDVANADAGRKAMIVNRIGDAAFLIGIFMLFWALQDLGSPSLAFDDVNRLAPSLGAQFPLVTTAICLLLFTGATGKSAQIPLYTWLPDAMAGPTPVSALIHAATMVTAGVYMIARLSPLFVQSPSALEVVAVVGAATALFSATIALAQNDLKKILAYSTVSQLGYMFIGVGVGAFSAGIFHLMTHAFFKALLFLCAGSVMHSLHGELDVWKMGGLRRIMPVTANTFLVAALAISGVFPFAAFFSKDLILEQAFERGHTIVWLLGVAAAGLTAFYTFRAYFLAFTGTSRLDPHVAKHAHESPAVMTVPLVILAVLSTIGGWIGLPHGWLWGNPFVAYLAPSLALLPEAAEPAAGAIHLGATSLMLLTSGIAFAGIGVAWILYGSPSSVTARIAGQAGAFYRLLWNKWYVDEIYDALVVRPYVGLSTFFWKVIDTELIDGVVNGVGRLVVAVGSAGRYVQTGLTQQYLFVMVIGAIGLLVALFRGA